MYYLTRRQKLIGLLAGILIVVISGTLYISREKPVEVVSAEEKAGQPASTPVPTPAPAEEAEEIIKVYICGAVKSPGMVEVKADTRLGEALPFVDGALEDADMNQVNLAHRLSDEEMVYIPKKGENTAETAVNIPGPAKTGKEPAASGKVNINTAGPEQLEKLKGIGSSTAKKIISYREEKGSFGAIEEIKNVPGIGDKKFADIKDYITVK